MLELFKCFHTENEVYQDFVVWWEHRHSMSGNYGEVQLHLNLGIHFHPRSLQIRQDSIFISSHFKSLGFLSYGFSFLMNVALKPIFFSTADFGCNERVFTQEFYGQECADLTKHFIRNPLTFSFAVYQKCGHLWPI